MKTLYLFGLLFFSFISFSAVAQYDSGPRFDQYPATKIKSKQRAPLDLSSSPLDSTFNAAIQTGYKKGRIDFGGHYISIFLSPGTDEMESKGVIVDVLTGKIYSMPYTELNSYREDSGDKKHDNTMHKAYSYLFVIYSSQMSETNINLITVNYFYYLFDDTSKQFSLVTTTTNDQVNGQIQELGN